VLQYFLSLELSIDTFPKNMFSGGCGRRCIDFICLVGLCEL